MFKAAAAADILTRRLKSHMTALFCIALLSHICLKLHKNPVMKRGQMDRMCVISSGHWYVLTSR